VPPTTRTGFPRSQFFASKIGKKGEVCSFALKPQKSALFRLRFFPAFSIDRTVVAAISSRRAPNRITHFYLKMSQSDGKKENSSNNVDYAPICWLFSVHNSIIAG
jgi:hypothetical protein